MFQRIPWPGQESRLVSGRSEEERRRSSKKEEDEKEDEDKEVRG